MGAGGIFRTFIRECYRALREIRTGLHGQWRLAIDEFFIELQPLVERTLLFKKDLRANSALAGD